MKHSIACAAAVAAISLVSAEARAGVYADDLGKCVIGASSTQDQVGFVQWFFSAISANPAVKSMTTFTAEQRDAYSKSAADIMQRLLLHDCRKEALAAVKYEGESALASSFELFGQVAARSLMSDPAVEAEMSRLERFVDTKQWEALGKESVTAPPAKK